jgi:hypothetical protein
MNERVRWTVMAASCVLVLGCGSSKDSDSGKDNDAGSSKGGTSGGGSGSSGNGSGGSASGTGGTMAGTGGMPGGAVAHNVDCGDNVCAGVQPGSMMGFPGFMLAEVCCADESAGTCGSISADDATKCLAPPEPDSRCPQVMGQPGCCADNNICGLDGSLAGRGCFGLDKLSAMFGNLPPAIKMMFMLPDVKTCDGSPLPDAGMMMSGDDAGM